MHSLKQHLQQMTNKIVLVPANNHISYISQSLFIHIHLLVQQLTKHNFAIQLKLNEATGQKKSYTHKHPFNGPFSATTQVSHYQKGKTNLDFTEARDSEWQWHQLGHMQVCTSLPTDNHATTVFYTPDAPPAVQPTASKH